MGLGPIGKVTVTVPGTPESAAKNLTAAEQQRFACHSVLIQVLPSNTGKIYIGNLNDSRFPLMNKATGAGLFAILAIPTTSLIQSFSATLNLISDTVDVAAIGIDADLAGEGVIISVGSMQI